MKLSKFIDLLKTRPPDHEAKFYCPNNNKYYYISIGSTFYSPIIIELTDNKYLSLCDNCRSTIIHLDACLIRHQDIEIKFYHNAQEFKIHDAS